MENKKIINQSYINEVLKPFIGKELRITEGSLLFPETSIETGFKIETTGWGICLYADQDSSGEFAKNMRELLHKSFRETGYFTLNLNRLDTNNFKDDVKYPPSGENDLWPKVEKYFMENLKVKIGQIYISSIQTIEIRQNGFKINDTFFRIRK